MGPGSFLLEKWPPDRARRPFPVSCDEIERTLSRFRATGFAYVTQPPRVAIAFEIARDWEQDCRQRWRTLAAAIKAKLAMIDDGISTIEQEFLANIVLPHGGTVGDRLAPEIEEISRCGQLPPLMPGLLGSKVVALGRGR